MAVRTIGTVLSEARTLLNDVVAISGSTFRYSDAQLIEAFNGAMVEARAKRPDLFLDTGMRAALPFYTTDDTGAAFPLDPQYYNAFVYYVVGRCELREDTFSNDGRAVVLINKFVSQLTSVAS